MSFWSKFANLFAGEKTVVIEELHNLETDVQPVIKAEEAIVQKEVVQPVESAVKDVEKAVEGEKNKLKAELLTALQDAKSELKNAEPGLSEDAQKAVQHIIDTAVQIMIKDGMGAL